MKKIKIIKFIYIIPAIFLTAGFWYQDPFFYLVAAIAFILSYLTVNPKVLAKHEALPFINTQTVEPVNKSKNEVVIRIDLDTSTIIYSTLMFLYFIYLDIFMLENTNGGDIFSKYFIAIVNHIQKQGLTFFIMLGLYLLALIFHNYRNKKYKKSRAATTSGIFFAASLIIIIPLSVAIVYLLAIGEINLLGIRSKGQITSGRVAVSQKLAGFDMRLHVIGGDHKVDNLTIYKALQDGDAKGTFYEDAIVASIPTGLNLFFSLPKDNMVLFGNYLLIRKMNKDDLQAITGTVVKLFVKNFISDKFVKNDPNFEVISRSDYSKYRQTEIDKDIKTLDNIIKSEDEKESSNEAAISYAYSNIQTLNSQIASDRAKITSDENTINDANAKQKNYDTCLGAGYRLYGQFYHQYSKEYCDIQRSNYDWNITTLKQEVSSLNDEISKDQTSINGFNQSIKQEQLDNKDINDGITYLNEVKKMGELKKSGTAFESGIFIPENNIKIVLDDIRLKSVSDYFETAVHEFFHYTSYVSEEKKQAFEPFFEEGLTEYFARKVIKNNLETTSGVGYPLNIKILGEMMKKISENDFANIYLTKDQVQLEALLNRAYGKNFYETTQTYIRQLDYANGNNQLILANIIMQKIGGKPIQLKDLLGTSSQ